MDLRTTQLKDTYGNLVTTGTTAGAPTSGGLQNGQGTLLTSVGIGTNSPATNLHISSSASTPALRIETTHPSGIPFLDLKGAASSQIRYIDETGTIQTRIDMLDSGGISFVDVAGGSERMRINSSGNVGIGTTSPRSILESKGAISIGDTQTTLGNDDPLVGIDFYTSDTSFASSDTNKVARIFPYSDSSVGQAFGLKFSTADTDTDATTRMTIDSSGNVGIGTNSPTEKLQINSGYIKVVDNAYDEYFLSKTRTDGSQLVGFQSHSLGALSIHSAGSERMRILSDGGITFNGDTATANALDDYEEGTWTPVFKGATTAGAYSFSTGGGKYTKIGNMVTVWCSMVDITESSAGSGSILIGGLPFTIANDSTNDRLATSVRIRQASTTRNNSIACGLRNTTDVLLVYDNNASGGGTAYTIASDFSANMDLGFQFSYFV